MKTKPIAKIAIVLVILFLLVPLFVDFKEFRFQIPTLKNVSENAAAIVPALNKAKCESLDIETDYLTETGVIFCINGKERIEALKLADMNASHYHSFEKVNGKLYLIRRIGYDGYPDETWTDELWRYDANLNGGKLYSDQGIDFRVSEDEKTIIMMTNDYLKILDSKGSVIKTFLTDELIVDYDRGPIVSFHAWGKGSIIWLDNTFGPSLDSLIKIDIKTFEVKKYSLSELPAGPEFRVNIYNEKIAFSNYPAMFDEDTAKDYMRSGSEVNLSVYDLNAGTQKVVATSITKAFQPVWLDENTLEFDDPDGTGRKSIKIDY